MKTVQLVELAHARSGDKGNMCNIGLIAKSPEYYRTLVEKVTAERVRRHFAGVCLGKVERFELPNLQALNFLLYEALDLAQANAFEVLLDAIGSDLLHQRPIISRLLCD